eukprot:XP_027303879.1 uncharacterized protein LOC113841417 [Anas platyrhynchos]
MAALAFCLRSPDAFAGKGIPSWPWSQPGLSLLQRLGTTDLATWDRRGVLAQPESGGVIVFPRIGLYIPSGRAAGGNPVQSPEKQDESCQGVPGAAAGQLTAALLAGTRSRMAEMAQVTWPFFSLLLQMEKKPQDIKTLPHCGVRQAERIQLPALPPLPRQAATLKQVPKAETSLSEKATCKLPPLQAAASATSARGRAKALGTEALSHRELLPPLPCVSAERDRAERAERWERVPHSPVALLRMWSTQRKSGADHANLLPVAFNTVQRCIQETLLFLSYTLAKKQAVDFIFKDIGRLVSRKSRVQMHFSSDFVHNLNSNGQLLKCRLTGAGSVTQLSSLERNLEPFQRITEWLGLQLMLKIFYSLLPPAMGRDAIH